MDYNRLTAITRESVMPKIVDQIKEASPTFGRFLSKIKRKSGTAIHVPVKYRQNTQGGYYSGLQVLDSAQETTRTRAVWNWVQFHKPIVISNIEEAMNAGEEGIVDLMSAEMEDAKDGMQDQLSTSFFSDGTGQSDLEMDGLRAAVDDGTNVATYAGINRSTYTWWQAQYTSLGTVLHLTDMATMYDSCEHNGKRPDFIVTTKDIWSDYEALLISQVRFVNSDGSANKADGGMSRLAFRATPVESDPYCPAGKMFFLNTDSFDFVYLKHPEHPTDSNGFALRPMAEPDNQDGKVGFIFFYHQLVCKEPRLNGQLTNIS